MSLYAHAEVQRMWLAVLLEDSRAQIEPNRAIGVIDDAIGAGGGGGGGAGTGGCACVGAVQRWTVRSK